MEQGSRRSPTRDFFHWIWWGHCVVVNACSHSHCCVTSQVTEGMYKGNLKRAGNGLTLNPVVMTMCSVCKITSCWTLITCALFCMYVILQYKDTKLNYKRTLKARLSCNKIDNWKPEMMSKKISPGSRDALNNLPIPDSPQLGL